MPGEINGLFSVFSRETFPEMSDRGVETEGGGTS